MINLKRNKRYYYLSKQLPDSLEFAEPIIQHLNYQPTNSSFERLTIGEDYSKFMKIKCTPKDASIYSNLDRLYIYVKPQEEYDSTARDADYYVYGDPIITLNEAEIRLRKFSGADEESH